MGKALQRDRENQEDVCVCVCVCVCTCSVMSLCDPVDCSPPGSSLSMGFPRQEYWSGLLFPTLGDLPDSGIKLVFLASLALVSGFFTSSAT